MKRKLERKLIRDFVYNIYDIARNIDIKMFIADRKNPDSTLAISENELKEVLILLEQADYLKKYIIEDDNAYTLINYPRQTR